MRYFLCSQGQREFLFKQLHIALTRIRRQRWRLRRPNQGNGQQNSHCRIEERGGGAFNSLTLIAYYMSIRICNVRTHYTEPASPLEMLIILARRSASDPMYEHWYILSRRPSIRLSVHIRPFCIRISVGLCNWYTFQRNKNWPTTTKEELAASASKPVSQRTSNRHTHTHAILTLRQITAGTESLVSRFSHIIRWRPRRRRQRWSKQINKKCIKSTTKIWVSSTRNQTNFKFAAANCNYDVDKSIECISRDSLSHHHHYRVAVVVVGGLTRP